MTPTIELKELSFGYGGELILENISLQISNGEFVALFGPNGGGKTTLLRLILGFLTPSSGSLRVFGQPPAKVRTRMAYVPQLLRFDKEFPITLEEMVLTGRLSTLPWYGAYRKADREAAVQVIEKVGLSQQRHYPFGSLSGGQAQRALIARALISQPELLVLDEPTASVDAAAESQIYDLVENLKREMTILMVTHHLEAIGKLVDRAICVKRHLHAFDPGDVCSHFVMGLYHPPIQLNRAEESE